MTGSRLDQYEQMINDLADVIEAYLIHGDVDLDLWVTKARTLTGNLPDKPEVIRE